MKTLKIFGLVAIFSLVFISCEKDDDDNVTPNENDNKFVLSDYKVTEVHGVREGETFDLVVEYNDDNQVIEYTKTIDNDSYYEQEKSMFTYEGNNATENYYTRYSEKDELVLETTIDYVLNDNGLITSAKRYNLVDNTKILDNESAYSYLNNDFTSSIYKSYYPGGSETSEFHVAYIDGVISETSQFETDGYLKVKKQYAYEEGELSAINELDSEDETQESETKAKTTFSFNGLNFVSYGYYQQNASGILQRVTYCEFANDENNCIISKSWTKEDDEYTYTYKWSEGKGNLGMFYHDLTDYYTDPTEVIR